MTLGSNTEDASPSPGCGPEAPVVVLPKDDWMETEVIMGFRVWQLMFLALAGLITVVVLLCCFMKCRVPRTKQEIEADFKRKEITRRFRFLLDRVQIEDTSLRTAIEKVNELYTHREKTKRRKKKKAEDEEEIVSVGSSYLFVDEALTLREKIKKLLGLLDENASDTDSMKETTDKSEDQLKKSTSVDDEQSSLKDVKVILEAAKPQQTSEESSDSPKMEESKSKMSLLEDSPPRTHDTLSRLSLIQDSPPNYGVTLLEDTPPSKKLDDVTERIIFGRQQTDSQDSSPPVRQQDSVDSDKSEKLSKQKSESQGRGRMNKSSKSDSQESENGKSRKQKSSSQESNDSPSSKSVKGTSRKLFEPQESKMSRRESVSGHPPGDIPQKWKKSANTKSKQEKSSKSLDINLSANS